MSAGFVERLTERLKNPLPGARVQAALQPELSYGRHFAPPPASARPAAVLVLLYPEDGAWHVPLTLRPENLATHGGQISLPGGLIEPGERSQDAALRELGEELGTPAAQVSLAGELSPIYLFASNYAILPWIATARKRPILNPNPAEVAELVEVPLAHLLEPASHSTCVRQVGGARFAAPSFLWSGHHIWGATSLILAELVAIVAEVGL